MSPNTKDYKLLIEEENATISSQPSLIAVKDNFSYISSLATTGVLPILTYCAASILMTVTNKYVLSGYEFNMNFLLLGVQSISCVLLLHIFKIFNLVTYRKLELEVSQKWFPIAAMLVAMIYTGSKSLQYLSIPVYTIFKNLTIILIAYGEVFWFEGTITRLTMSSFLLMVLSSIIAAWSDISTVFSEASYAPLNLGYFWMCLNCISSAAFVLTMRKYIKSMGFKDFDTVYYNNFLSIPLLVVLSFMMEDWSVKNLETNFPVEVRSTLVMAILFSGISAFAISYASAWCVRVTSSTTYSMVGALNKLPVAASGMIFFDDPVTVGSVSAITVGFIAGIVYSIAKSAQSKLVKQNVDDLPKPVSSQLKKC